MNSLTPTAIDREIDDILEDLVIYSENRYSDPSYAKNGITQLQAKERLKQLIRQVTDEVIGQDEPDRFATRNRLRKQQRHHRDKLLGEEK